MVMGFRTTQLVHVAARLGLADVLHERPACAEELAPLVGADVTALRRILRALASLGLVASDGDGRYRTAPLGQALRRDVPGSVHALAVLYGEQWLWSAYGRTMHSVRTGEPGFVAAHGRSLYEFLDAVPEAAAAFHGAMSGYSAQEESAILAAHDFGDCATVVDVGGGEGALLQAILRAHPTLHGVLFDLPTAVSAVADRVDPAVRDRLEVDPGDFFTGVTPGGDCYVLKSVLHNWDDEHAVAILRACRDAMAQGRVLVVERVVPDGDGPSEAALFDVNMLVVVGGRERTAEEYRALFAAAGLTVTRIVATASPLSIVEGRPVDAPV
jgi:hypothetical protein